MEKDSDFSLSFLVSLLLFFFVFLPLLFWPDRLLPQHQPDDEPDKLSNRVFQFDPSKDRWTECASMRYSRYRCGTAVLNGEIYILGWTKKADGILVFKYEFQIWKNRTPKMCLCSSGGIGCDGEDRGQSRRCLCSVEIYNPETDTWRAGPTLPTTLLSLRTNASNLGVVDGKLYLCGYFKGAGKLLNTWHVFFF